MDIFLSSNIISQLREELRNTREQLQDLDSQQNVSNNTIKQLRDQLAETTQQLVHSSAAGRELEAEVVRLRDHHGKINDNNLFILGFS